MGELYNGWERVTVKNPCPVCGKPDWCLTQADGSAAICQRVEEGSTKYLDDAGYLHRLRDRGTDRSVRSRPVAVCRVREGVNPMTGIAVGYTMAVVPSRLNAFAKSLGLTTANLRRMRVGWAERLSAWSFPMSAANGEVIGIRLRSEDGQKFAQKDSHQGLHIPLKIGKPQQLLLTEGPTDAVAMLDLGFAAVGRPSCVGATAITVDLVKRLQPASLIIIADNDKTKPDGSRPGIDGAKRLAAALALHTKSLKVVLPPGDIKDARLWKIAGATPADVQAAIDAATPYKVVFASTPSSGEVTR